MSESADKGLIYKNLSYQLMGVLFKVHNKLGPAYQEKYYQRAIEKELKKQKIPFDREHRVKLNYEGENIGHYFIDFVVNDKIALEVKSIRFLKGKYLNQVLAYLSSANLKLGILVNFNAERLYYKRIINPKVIS
ncbi:GxxExxY protein [Patescibacteria group bacterium]